MTHVITGLKQLICSWRRGHDLEEIGDKRFLCTKCGKGWFFDHIYSMWRDDRAMPGSAP